MLKKVFLVVISLILIFITGCNSLDPIPASDDVYITNLYIWTGTAWAKVVGSGAEVDPIWSASPSSGITAGDILNWDSLISSQWVTDANGIYYDLGNVGINANSVNTELLRLYSHDGVANNPVLLVHDNSASGASQGIYVSTSGAKTGDSYGINISNATTSNTGGLDKYGLYIMVQSLWNGAGAKAYGLYVNPPTGATENITAHFGNTTDYSEWDENGFMSLTGDAVAWDDLLFPVSSIRLTSVGINPPLESATILPGVTYAFEDKGLAGQEQSIVFVVQLPHSYKEGSDIYFHIHYAYPIAQNNTRSLWKLEYDWQNDGGTFNTGTSTVSCYTDYTDGTTLKNKLSSFGVISGAGKDISSILVCRLYRNSSDVSDNYTAQINLLEVDVHIENDTLGSRTQFNK